MIIAVIFVAGKPAIAGRLNVLVPLLLEDFYRLPGVSTTRQQQNQCAQQNHSFHNSSFRSVMPALIFYCCYRTSPQLIVI
jgi:hypothetical protein